MTSVATTTDFRSALRARDRAGINDVAARLLDQRTRLGDQWLSVAHVLVRNGEVNLALSAAERAVEECGDNPRSRLELAHVLASVGRQDEALALASAIPAAEVDSVDRDHFVGTCAMELGDFRLARDTFDRLVARWPGSGPTWLSLAVLPAYDDGALLDRLSDAASAVQATPPDYRAQWHYAKGTLLDRLGRYDEAFATFAQGADLVKPTRSYDPDADRREAEMLIAEFTRESIDRIARQVSTDASRPILVTGLPRSGTTLVEQILASHSMIAGGGEMPFGSILTREIGGKSLSRLETFMAAHGADDLTRLYLHLGDERFGEGRRFIDKGLGNSRTLGVLASVLPKMRIIWLRRDPLDCAWSCFRTFFSRGIEWSWSLVDIAAHFRVEDALHSHWQDVVGERMLTLSYEELATGPSRQTEQILAHVGIEAEAAVNTAHKERRAVTTASVAQVREPVYQSSIGAADPYRAHLGPFMEAYGAINPAD